MEIILNLLKAVGILLTSYYSYIALTKKLKTEDGTLTKHGRRSKNGIIISGLFSLVIFILSSNLPKEPDPELVRQSDQINFPVEEARASGETTIYIDNDYWYEDSKIIELRDYFDRWKLSGKFPANGKPYVAVSGLKSENPEAATLYFDSIGKPEYFYIDPDYLQTFSFFINKRYSPGMKPVKIYFTREKDSSIYKNFFNKNSPKPIDSKFDLIYQPRLEKIEGAYYYPKNNKILLESEYKLTLVKNSGKIENLKKIVDCYSFMASPNFLVINSTRFYNITTAKGLSLKNELLYNYRPKTAIIPYPYEISSYHLDFE